MDLSNNNINNNSNNGKSSKDELEVELPETMIQSLKSPRGHKGKAKSEQFASARGERRKKGLKPGKQQETNSQPDCPILLASNSNTGRALQDAPSGWCMEETSFSYSRKVNRGRGNISEEYREHLLGSAASNNTTRELLDNKIDRDVVVVGRKEGFGGDEQEQESSRIKTVFARTSSPLYHRLARVDPIVDFFAVDEELLGRFRICSCLLPHQISRSSSGGSSSTRHAVTAGGGGSAGEGGIQQHAIIFKIKTTSPYSFWVRPIYGLMRPNVMAWVEVKCDLKANSLAKIEQDMDEFVVEICPVPGALHTMTNDLYTSCVPSNLPELLSIWERVETELKGNQLQLQGFIKEFHRITCRFQRSSLASSVQSIVEADTTLQPLTLLKKQEKHDIVMKDDISEKTENNNVKIYQWNPFSSPQAQQTTSGEERYRLAREFPFHHHSDEGSCEEQCHNHRRKFGKKSSRCCCFPCCGCCSAFRKLCCLSFILGVLLLAALAFIFYTQYYQYFINNDTSSYNDNNKNALVVSNNNKRYFHR